jgi:hypothetical protein
MSDKDIKHDATDESDDKNTAEKIGVKIGYAMKYVTDNHIRPIGRLTVVLLAVYAIQDLALGIGGSFNTLLTFLAGSVALYTIVTVAQKVRLVRGD